MRKCMHVFMQIPPHHRVHEPPSPCASASSFETHLRSLHHTGSSCSTPLQHSQVDTALLYKDAALQVRNIPRLRRPAVMKRLARAVLWLQCHMSGCSRPTTATMVQRHSPMGRPKPPRKAARRLFCHRACHQTRLPMSPNASECCSKRHTTFHTLTMPTKLSTLRQ